MFASLARWVRTRPRAVGLLALCLGALSVALAAVTALGGFKPSGEWWPAGLGAIGAFLLAVGASSLMHRRDTQLARVDALSALVDPFPPAPALHEPVGAPSVLLMPEYAVARTVQGRTSDLSMLLNWCLDENAEVLGLLVGPTLVGKTRLAMELGATLARKGWLVGAPVVGREVEALHAASVLTGPHLLVIELANNNANIQGLLDQLTRTTKRDIRVLVVAPSVNAVVVRSRGVTDLGSAILAAATTFDLVPVGGEDDIARWAMAAAKDFADALGVRPPERRKVYHASGPIGLLHAQVLADVLSENTTDQVAGTEGALAYIADRVRRSWPTLGNSPLPGHVEDRVIATAWFDNAADPETLNASLTRIPEFSDSTMERRREVVQWASTLLESFGNWRVSRSLPLECIAIKTLGSDSSLVTALSRGVPTWRFAESLARLVGASTVFPSAMEIATAALIASGLATSENILGAVYSAAQADLRTDLIVSEMLTLTPPPKEAVKRILADVSSLPFMDRTRLSLLTIREGGVESIEGLVLDPDGALDLANCYSDLGMYSTSRHLLKRYLRRRGDVAEGEDRTVEVFCARAKLLIGQSYLSMGDHVRAAKWLKRSVSHWDRLLDDPNLAAEALVSKLDELQCELELDYGYNALPRMRQNSRQDALPRIRQLSQQFARLSPEQPPGLHAAVQMRVASLLLSVGPARDALGPSAEAVRYARLANKGATDGEQVAAALSVHGGILLTTNAFPDAIKALEECVAICERLHAYNERKFASWLASGSLDLAAAYGNSLRYRDTVHTASRAASLCRAAPLEDDWRRPLRLARALELIGAALPHAEPSTDSTKYLREALSLYRGVAESRGSTWRMRLDTAAASVSLGAVLSNSGDHKGALPLMQEAVNSLELLRSDGFEIDLPALGQAYFNLGVIHMSLGRQSEAEAPFRAALTVYSVLADMEPEVYLHYVRECEEGLRRLEL